MFRKVSLKKKKKKVCKACLTNYFSINIFKIKNKLNLYSWTKSKFKKGILNLICRKFCIYLCLNLYEEVYLRIC